MTHHATALSPSSHQDTFARDHLPPADQWPVFLFDTPEVQYPEQLNATQALVDQHIAQGNGERIDVVAPHPLAKLHFNNVLVPHAKRIGAAGEGFKVAMATLDVFRTSVAAASLGFARRALDESIAWAKQRKMFGQSLGDFQITQSKLAQMATLLDAATLLTYRAAWLRDQGQRITQEAAMAKMTATENAQQIIDMAVQMHGGMGVKKGCIVESLYREIRALRIYEGATEVQQLIIGRDLLK